MIFLRFALWAATFVAWVGAAAGEDNREFAIERGSKIYYTYCVSCHGVNGEGNGKRAAKLETLPSNFARIGSPKEYMELMIRKGGESIGRSRAMPPWEDELSNENIEDVISFVASFRKI